MKLAEALIKRIGLDKEINDISARLLQNAEIQAGEKPLESSESLIDILNEKVEQLENLVRRINNTNSKTKVDDIYSVSDLVTKKERYKRLFKIFRLSLNIAYSRFNGRHMRTRPPAMSNEVKTLLLLDTKIYEKHCSQSRNDLYDIEKKIHQINWATELL